MFVLKRCSCGCGDFYQEDDGTWRCQDCNRLADFEYVDPNQEYCVCCGKPIPEGEQVCFECKNKI